MAEVWDYDGLPPPSEEIVHGILFKWGEKQEAFNKAGYFVYHTTFEMFDHKINFVMDAFMAEATSLRHFDLKRVIDAVKEFKERDA